MTDVPDEEPAAAAALPKEAERRAVEDADARGIPVVLQGGETWFVMPMPLSPRGLLVAKLIEDINGHEVDLAAAQRSVLVVEKRLDDEATTDEEIEAARGKLRSAVAKRGQAAHVLSAAHRELAYHALRSLYRVTRDETAVLVTQRHWPDVLAALTGKDTTRSQMEMAIELFERMQRAGRPAGPDTPLARPTSSGGAAPS